MKVWIKLSKNLIKVFRKIPVKFVFNKTEIALTKSYTLNQGNKLFKFRQL
jgi:hypothetical protein